MTSTRRIAQRRRLDRERAEGSARRLGGILLAFLLSGAILLAAMLWNVWWHNQEALALLPASPAEHQPQRPSTHFFDRSGERLLATLGAPQETSEIWRALEELPAPLIAATRWLSGSLEKPETPTPPLTLAWQLLSGSYWQELPPAPGISGQLAREQILPPAFAAVAAERVREWASAAALRRQFTADELLEWQLNRAAFGEGLYGADSAAAAHFGIAATELNATQSIQLAWLSAVSANHPTGTDYDSLLVAMSEYGILNANELAQARAAGALLPLAAKPLIHSGVSNFIELAQEQTTRILTGYGYDAGDAFAAGLEIITTLDFTFQLEAQRQISDFLTLADDIGYDSAVLVSVNTADGSIRGMVGAAHKADAPPAPLLLPFLYFESLRGKSVLPTHAATMLLDTPTTYPHPEIAGLRTAARNADDQFCGPILLADALRELRAVPAYEAVAGAQGLAATMRVAGRLGWASLADEAPLPTLLTDGGAVSALDTAYVYATFAARGVMHGLPAAMDDSLDRPHEPLAILEIRDAAGDTLWRHDAKDNANQTPILDRALADLMNALLRGDNDYALLSGTSGPSIDAVSGAWTLQFSPDQATALHLRREDRANFELAPTLADSAADLTTSLATYYGAGVAWPGSENLQERVVCARSGGLANGNCEERRLPFLPGIAPTEIDNRWQIIAINRTNGLLASDETPTERREERVFFTPPAAALAWWLENGYEIAPTASDTATSATARLRLQPQPALPQRGVIPIVGWFELIGLRELHLEYGTGATPSQWQPIATFIIQAGQTPTELPATLAEWGTASLNGTFTIRARASYNDGTLVTDTARILLDNRPPQFELASHQLGEATQILVTSDDTSDISSLEYHLDGVPLGLQSSPPFGFILPFASVPPAQLRAVAHDAASNSSEQTLILPP